jgi:hypothetical protein
MKSLVSYPALYVKTVEDILKLLMALNLPQTQSNRIEKSILKIFSNHLEVVKLAKSTLKSMELRELKLIKKK